EAHAPTPLAVGPPASAPAGPMGRTSHWDGGILVGRANDRIVDARTRPDGDLGTDADTDGLDRVDAHDDLRQAAVQLAIPLYVRPEARWHAGDDDLERAAERVARGAGRVDGGDHLLLHVRVHTVKR